MVELMCEYEKALAEIEEWREWRNAQNHETKRILKQFQWLEQTMTRAYYRLQQAEQARARGELMLDASQFHKLVHKAAKGQRRMRERNPAHIRWDRKKAEDANREQL